MCSVSHDLKAVFIHIHKTGGTYLSYVLHKHYGFKNYYIRRPDHDLFCKNKKKTTRYLNYENKVHGVLNYYKTSPFINKKMGMDARKWDTYFKFCFIRNPYDRLISGWYHVNKYKIPLDNYLNIKTYCNDVDYIHVFMPQVKHIINEKGKMGINFIGRFENLEEDFQLVLKKLGVKRILHTPTKTMNVRDHKHFSEYYTPSILTKVNQILREDFLMLPYKMTENMQKFIEVYGLKEDQQNSEQEEQYKEQNEEQYLEHEEQYLEHEEQYLEHEESSEQGNSTEQNSLEREFVVLSDEEVYKLTEEMYDSEPVPIESHILTETLPQTESHIKSQTENIFDFTSFKAEVLHLNDLF